MNWDIIYYIGSWVTFGFIAFLLAFMKDLRATFKRLGISLDLENFLEVPIELRQKLLTLSAMKTALWFVYGFTSAFLTWVTFYLSGSIASYLTINGLLSVAGVALTPILGKEGWQKILIWIQKLLGHYHIIDRKLETDSDVDITFKIEVDSSEAERQLDELETRVQQYNKEEQESKLLEHLQVRSLRDEIEVTQKKLTLTEAGIKLCSENGDEPKKAEYLATQRELKVKLRELNLKLEILELELKGK